LVYELSEDLLKAFSNLQLIDKYDVYQHLMAYWNEVMQDDVYSLVVDGWQAGKEIEKDEKKKEWQWRIIPKKLIIARYFPADQKTIESFESSRDVLIQKMEELEEEHGGEEGLLADAKNDKDKITKASVKDRLEEIEEDKESADERKVLEAYLKLAEQETEYNRKIKDMQAVLERKVLDKYKALTETEIKTLIVEDKWIAAIENGVQIEMNRISQRLTGRIKELAERYATPLPRLVTETEEFVRNVDNHLTKMGYKW
jgi:type I restriction enzyme M protein